MSDPPKKRGGSHSARAKGLVGVVVHVSPVEHAELKRAALTAGVTLKDYCKAAALEAARRRE